LASRRYQIRKTPSALLNLAQYSVQKYKIFIFSVRR
jgi:hypothetical protein